MKKTLFAVAMLLVAGNFNISAQQAAPQAEKKFTVVKQNPITPVRNQASTGTCWCFATVSFLESELLRKGYKGDLDLSEMFIVSHSYAEKVDKYVRMNGNMGFGQGSEGGDAITIIKEHGIVPESIMTGLNYGTDRHSHGELASLVTSFAKTMATARSYTSVWKRGLKALIANYLGEIPETFEYNGKTYTPESYRDAIGLTNLDDYVFVTSFTHHPFYTQFAIEAPDNWRG
ncbi:MAG: aminopeptidase, partial [Bacteroidales bacterium]|nr:aminopeptidase [Bacteroidales bacterium]